ncbi:MAG: NnrS family protein [Terriglobales bacterium]
MEAAATFDGSGPQHGGAAPDPLRIFENAKAYEQRLSRLLMAFLATGLVFLLGPGSLLGLANLFAISRHEAVHAVGAAWLQAHGQAEVFGWVGSFILGIGFHSLTRRGGHRIRLGWAWACWWLWTAGIALRWPAGVYAWHWRVLLPLGGAAALAAFVIFQRTIAGAHRPRPGEAREPTPGWILLVLTGAAGFALSLLLTLGGDVWLALRAHAPVLPPELDQRVVAVLTWSFVVPFVLGFSTRWFPIFAGLRPAPERGVRWLAVLVAVGTGLELAGWTPAAAIAWLGVALLAVVALGIARPPRQPAKIQGVHGSFPLFLRAAYGWLVVAASLGVWAALDGAASGTGGASRHALTVGFIAGMVLTIGPRILPAFSGMKALYSPRLMLLALVLLEAGCLLRVTGEVLAYPGWLALAWAWLPWSAALEVAAFVVFAYNLARTLLRPPEHMRLRQA